MKNETKKRRSSEINKSYLLSEVKKFHLEICHGIRNQLFQKKQKTLIKIVSQSEGDVSFKIDVEAEKYIEAFANRLSQLYPLRIIVEGFGEKKFPENCFPLLDIIIDPIDGTRGIMYDFRSAWIETGIAFLQENKAKINDIQLAVQTEIPTTKQDKISILWAIKGQGSFEEIWDLRNENSLGRKKLHSSEAKDLKQGFAVFVDFFPGSKQEIAGLAENVFEKVLGPVEKGKAAVFNDQYICSAGQVYLLSSGKYRFVADLRSEMEKIINKKGRELSLTAHPYDLATTLIAQEAGVIITDGEGKELSYTLDIQTNCSWIGYANEKIRAQVEPILMGELKKIRTL